MDKREQIKHYKERFEAMEEQVSRLSDSVWLKLADNTAALETVIRAWMPQISDTIVAGLMPVFIDKIRELEKRVAELEEKVEIGADIERQLHAARAASAGLVPK